MCPCVCVKNTIFNKLLRTFSFPSRMKETDVILSKYLSDMYNKLKNLNFSYCILKVRFRINNYKKVTFEHSLF